jgi:imidazolonepropionase-like amidohydrolase
MLRSELIKAQEYARKAAKADAKEFTRDLKMDALADVLSGKVPLLVTAHRSYDILTAIRVGKEFGLKLVLDGAAEAYLVMDQVKASGYPVILHPTMMRSFGEAENLSLETASRLRQAGIPFALQSGFEAYVPKTRVALFEAGVAAANGLRFEDALASITIDAARILGIDKRVGSLEPGKDADIALYDGDPFEYTSHCTGVILNGRVVSEARQ